MKQNFILSVYLILTQVCFADIPLDNNGNNQTAISDLNYLPWVLGLMMAVAILIFIYVLKNNKNATK